MSRYRFRVGIGKLFQDRDVFAEISKNIKKRKRIDLTTAIIGQLIEDADKQPTPESGQPE